MLEDIRQFRREIGYRYFVRGDVKPKVRMRVPTDFGDGIYAWEDNEEGLASATDWATSKARRLSGSAVAVVQLLRIGAGIFDGLRMLRY